MVRLRNEGIVFLIVLGLVGLLLVTALPDDLENELRPAFFLVVLGIVFGAGSWARDRVSAQG